MVLPVLKGHLQERWGDPLHQKFSDRTRDNSFKHKEGRFRIDIRNKFFTMRMLRHWNRMPREAMDATSLEVFSVGLERALSNLFWKVSLSMEGRLD